MVTSGTASYRLMDEWFSSRLLTRLLPSPKMVFQWVWPRNSLRQSWSAVRFGNHCNKQLMPSTGCTNFVMPSTSSCTWLKGRQHCHHFLPKVLKYVIHFDSCLNFISWTFYYLRDLILFAYSLYKHFDQGKTGLGYCLTVQMTRLPADLIEPWFKVLCF